LKSLDQAFDDFRSEAFRFERLPSYNIPNERALVDEYTGGASLPDENSAAWKAKFDNWHSFLRECTSQNKRIVRVRMINSPMDSYLNWELEWAYPSNVRAGEEVLVLPENRCKELFSTIPSDFWLLDASAPFDMIYTDDGAFREAVPGRESLDFYLRTRELLLKEAVSLRSYFANQRQSRQF
jgi:hypothetical protein